MKKVLSALVLSAAVVATAGQAHAFGNNFLTQTIYGTYFDYTLNDETQMYDEVVKFAEIGVEHGFNLNLSQSNVALNQVNYNSLFSTIQTHTVEDYIDEDGNAAQRLVNANAAVTGLKTGYWIDGVIGAGDNVKDFYYVTTTSDKIKLPTATKFGTANSSANVVATFYNGKDNATPGITSAIEEAEEQPSSYINRMNQATDSPGVYGGINLLNFEVGQLDIDAMEGDVANLYLWHLNYTFDGVNPSVVSLVGDDYAATISFNKTTGQSVLNPVPVPAAAWLLGSGVLGLFGLRRRK
jgi:hypothetical protein